MLDQAVVQNEENNSSEQLYQTLEQKQPQRDQAIKSNIDYFEDLLENITYEKPDWSSPSFEKNMRYFDKRNQTYGVTINYDFLEKIQKNHFLESSQMQFFMNLFKKSYSQVKLIAVSCYFFAEFCPSSTDQLTINCHQPRFYQPTHQQPQTIKSSQELQPSKPVQGAINNNLNESNSQQEQNKKQQQNSNIKNELEDIQNQLLNNQCTNEKGEFQNQKSEQLGNSQDITEQIKKSNEELNFRENNKIDEEIQTENEKQIENKEEIEKECVCDVKTNENFDSTQREIISDQVQEQREQELIQAEKRSLNQNQMVGKELQSDQEKPEQDQCLEQINQNNSEKIEEQVPEVLASMPTEEQKKEKENEIQERESMNEELNQTNFKEPRNQIEQSLNIHKDSHSSETNHQIQPEIQQLQQQQTEPKKWVFTITQMTVTQKVNPSVQEVYQIRKLDQLFQQVIEMNGISLEQLNQQEFIYFPINQQQAHWISAVLDLKRKKFYYFDSYYSKVDDLVKNGIYKIMEYLGLQKDEYEFVQKTNKQENGYDCGIFALMSLLYTYQRKSEYNYTQEQVTQFRKRTLYDLAVIASQKDLNQESLERIIQSNKK